MPHPQTGGVSGDVPPKAVRGRTLADLGGREGDGAVYGSGFHLAQLPTMWGPLGLMVVFVTWRIVLRRRARAELRRINRAGTQ